MVKIGVGNINAKPAQAVGIPTKYMTLLGQFALAETLARWIGLVNQAVHVSAQSVLLRILRLHQLLAGATHSAADVRTMQVVQLCDLLEIVGPNVEVDNLGEFDLLERVFQPGAGQDLVHHLDRGSAAHHNECAQGLDGHPDAERADGLCGLVDRRQGVLCLAEQIVGEQEFLIFFLQRAEHRDEACKVLLHVSEDVLFS